MLDRFFRQKPIQEFAALLTEDIVKRYPPRIDASPDKRPSVNRMTRIVEDACEKAIAFQAEHRLGWFGKARLANALRWSLNEKGYKQDFVELVTEALVVYLSKKKT